MSDGFNTLAAVNKAQDFICPTRRGIFLYLAEQAGYGFYLNWRGTRGIGGVFF